MKNSVGKLFKLSESCCVVMVTLAFASSGFRERERDCVSVSLTSAH